MTQLNAQMNQSQDPTARAKLIPLIVNLQSTITYLQLTVELAVRSEQSDNNVILAADRMAMVRAMYHELDHNDRAKEVLREYEVIDVGMRGGNLTLYVLPPEVIDEQFRSQELELRKAMSDELVSNLSQALNCTDSTRSLLRMSFQNEDGEWAFQMKTLLPACSELSARPLGERVISPTESLSSSPSSQLSPNSAASLSSSVLVMNTRLVRTTSSSDISASSSGLSSPVTSSHVEETDQLRRVLRSRGRHRAHGAISFLFQLVDPPHSSPPVTAPAAPDLATVCAGPGEVRAVSDFHVINHYINVSLPTSGFPSPSVASCWASSSEQPPSAIQDQLHTVYREFEYHHDIWSKKTDDFEWIVPPTWHEHEEEEHKQRHVGFSAGGFFGLHPSAQDDPQQPTAFLDVVYSTPFTSPAQSAEVQSEWLLFEGSLDILQTFLARPDRLQDTASSRGFLLLAREPAVLEVAIAEYQSKNPNWWTRLRSAEEQRSEPVKSGWRQFLKTPIFKRSRQLLPLVNVHKFTCPNGPDYCTLKGDCGSLLIHPFIDQGQEVFLPVGTHSLFQSDTGTGRGSSMQSIMNYILRYLPETSHLSSELRRQQRFRIFHPSSAALKATVRQHRQQQSTETKQA